MNKELLLEMLSTQSVSGREMPLTKKMKDYMTDFCDECTTDTTGNVYGRLNPEKPVSVLLSGHIDEIGMMVSGFSAEGYVYVAPVGGIRPQQYLGQKVRIYSGDSIVYGAVGSASDLMGKKVECSDLWVDIGAMSKIEAMSYVKVGDRITFDTDYRELKNGRLSARAMDNRTGAFIVTEALRMAKQKGCTIGAVASCTVGEETTMRGAYSCAATFHPVCAIAVDVTYTYDYPYTDSHMGNVELGKGPVLCEAPIVNPKLNEKLEETAKELNMSYQWEVASRGTGTDADKMFYTNKGVPVALVSLPLRYMHSPDEVGDYRDIEDCIELLAEFLCRFGTENNFSLNPLD